MNFNDVIGQEEAKNRLMQMVQENRLPHAMLLCGPAGSGKFALALALASHILRGGKEQGASANTEAMLRKLQHPDLHFSYPTIKQASMSADRRPVSDDFAAQWNAMLANGPYFSLEQWTDEIGEGNKQAIITAAESDELTRKLSLKSNQGGYKVSIIWQPERMNTECANKMLKMIEEPPQRMLFILVSDNPDKLLETIRSRTQRIDVKKIDDESIVRALMEQRGISQDAAKRIARIANGSWLAAMGELTASKERTLFLETFVALMRLAYKRDIKSLRKWSDEVASWTREKQKQFLEYFLRLVRENFMYNFGNPELCYMTEEEERFAVNFARFVNEGNILMIRTLAEKAIRDTAQNANSKIVFFDFALNMIILLIQK